MIGARARLWWGVPDLELKHIEWMAELTELIGIRWAGRYAVLDTVTSGNSASWLTSALLTSLL